MGMTDKERLYDWICWKTKAESKSLLFLEISKEESTYFLDIIEQPVLEEYFIDNKEQLQRYMNIYLDEDLSEIRTVCINIILKKLHEFSAESVKMQETEKIKSAGIREYIYNF